MMEQPVDASQQPSQKVESRPIDLRPESSPYTNPLLSLHFGDGPALIIPDQFFAKRPRLSHLFSSFDRKVQLKHISGAAGHVLVHYLFTGTYECLKPKGSSLCEKDTSEFATSVRVYAVAQEYELPDLEALARGEMVILGRRLQVTQILDVLNDALPTPSVGDLWIQSYIASLVRPFLNSSKAPSCCLPDSSGKPLSIANTLLKVVIELWGEKSNSRSLGLSGLGAIEARHDEPVAEIGPAAISEHDPTPIFESTPEEEAFYNKSQEGQRKKVKKEKKEKKKSKKKKTENSHDTAVEEQQYSNGDEDRPKEDEGNWIPSAVPMITDVIPSSESAASNTKHKQQTNPTVWGDGFVPSNSWLGGSVGLQGPPHNFNTMMTSD
ncbi:hypothetical protein GGS24DRAFT_473174 [Hypoxylon argillaceum]|nr:hypothetical protein GGS24DRAFT_473174 [Hypoxylon argillaceum]